MDLRAELMPPVLNENTVARLAQLANEIDGGGPREAANKVKEFNRIAGVTVPYEEFQGIGGGQSHEDWVRKVLLAKAVRPARNIRREELVELVRRAMPTNDDPQYEAYMAIFDANVSPGASNLIFNPPDYDANTNTWGGGEPMGDYNPTPEQVVDWALKHRNGSRGS